jgi:hypothetical protein
LDATQGQAYIERSPRLSVPLLADDLDGSKKAAQAAAVLSPPPERSASYVATHCEERPRGLQVLPTYEHFDGQNISQQHFHEGVAKSSPE